MQDKTKEGRTYEYIRFMRDGSVTKMTGVVRSLAKKKKKADA